MLLTLATLSIVLVLYTIPGHTDDVPSAPAAVLGTLTPQSYLPMARKDSTPTLGLSDIQILFVDYNPDLWDIINERVDFHNYGGSQDMTGWTLTQEADGNVYHFPSGFVFGANAGLTLWTKSGTDTQSELYWGRTRFPIWRDIDTATLRDNNGTVVDQMSWSDP
jgi:hypothetical protein